MEPHKFHDSRQSLLSSLNLSICVRLLNLAMTTIPESVMLAGLHSSFHNVTPFSGRSSWKCVSFSSVNIGLARSSMGTEYSTMS